MPMDGGISERMSSLTRFGMMPAWGFFIRHARDIGFTQVDLSFMKPDTRPAFVLDQATDVSFQRVAAPMAPGVASWVLLKSQNIRIGEKTLDAPGKLEF